jgi:polyisoprenoid-binding protein YceI
MKAGHGFNPFINILIFSLLALLTASAYGAETYKLDPDHTGIVFRIKHLDIAYVYGRFNKPSGTFVYDESSPANSSIELQVRIDNVDTAVEARDKHIKSEDFLNAAEYSIASFKSTSVRKMSDGTFEVTGQLTVLGKSRSVVFKATQTGFGKDPWGNFRRGFETTFTIKRSEFGVDFMLSGISDEIDLMISLEGIRQ